MKSITTIRLVSTVIFGSCCTVFAQFIDPTTASSLVTETWKVNGLAGLLTLAQIITLGYLGWITKRYLKLLATAVEALANVSNSQRALVDAIRGMPCQASRLGVNLHQTPNPLDSLRPINTSVDTPV